MKNNPPKVFMLKGVKGYLRLRLGRILVRGEGGVCTHVEQGIVERPSSSTEGGIVWKGSTSRAGAFVSWDRPHLHIQTHGSATFFWGKKHAFSLLIVLLMPTVKTEGGNRRLQTLHKNA